MIETIFKQWHVQIFCHFLEFYIQKFFKALFLSKLDPPFSDDDVWDVGGILTTYTFPLCRERGGLKTVLFSIVAVASIVFFLGCLLS